MTVNLPIAASIVMLSYSSLNGGISFSQPEPKVEVYDYVEITINVDNPGVYNPFVEASVEGKFQKDGG